jgi:hypothetical protein
MGRKFYGNCKRHILSVEDFGMAGIGFLEGLMLLFYLAPLAFALWCLYTIARSLASTSETLREIRDLLRERPSSPPPAAG